MNKDKTYKMKSAENYIGIKMSSNNTYFDDKAQNAYSKRAKKLMKFQQH